MDIVQNVLSHAVKDIQIRDGHGVVAHVVSCRFICANMQIILAQKSGAYTEGSCICVFIFVYLHFGHFGT